MAKKDKKSATERSIKNMYELGSVLRSRRDSLMRGNDALSTVDAIMRMEENDPGLGKWEDLGRPNTGRRFTDVDEAPNRFRAYDTDKAPLRLMQPRGGGLRNPLGAVDMYSVDPDAATINRRKFSENRMLELNDLTGQHHGNFGPEWGEQENPDGRPISDRRADSKLLERRQDTQPAEKWKPFEQYDKFRKPGFWRGDDEEIKRNPALPSPKRNLDRRSFLQAPEAIPLEAAIKRVAMEGRYGDTELAHVNPEEKMLLAMAGGAGTVNPSTGAMEFYQDGPAKPTTDTGQPKVEQATGVSKFAVKELKALRDMIRDAKRSGKSEDKKTLKEITKRHKKLLENLMSDKPATDDVKSVPLDVAVKRVAMEGTGSDTMLAHVNPEEAKLLKSLGGSGTINPNTGLVQYDVDGTGSYGGSGDHAGSSWGGGGETSGGTTNGGEVGGVAGPDAYDTYGDFTGNNTPVGPGISAADQGWAPQEAGMYSGPSKPSQTYDASNNWGLGIGDASAFAGTGKGVLGALNYAAEVGVTPAMAGVQNSLNNMTFGDIAGFIGGAAVSTLVGGIAGPVLAGVAGPIAGTLGGKAVGSIAGNYAGNAITSAVNNGLPTGQATATNPNSSAPTTTADMNYNGSPTSENRGMEATNYDPRIAPLTSAQVTPLAVQPTTTVTDGNTTNNPFLSGIYIPPIGAPTAGRPLRIST